MSYVIAPEELYFQSGLPKAVNDVPDVRKVGWTPRIMIPLYGVPSPVITARLNAPATWCEPDHISPASSETTSTGPVPRSTLASTSSDCSQSGSGWSPRMIVQPYAPLSAKMTTSPNVAELLPAYEDHDGVVAKATPMPTDAMPRRVVHNARPMRATDATVTTVQQYDQKPMEITFIDADGDEIKFMKEAGGVQAYANGELWASNVKVLSIDPEGRSFTWSRGDLSSKHPSAKGRFQIGEDLRDIMNKRDYLFQDGEGSQASVVQQDWTPKRLDSTAMGGRQPKGVFPRSGWTPKMILRSPVEVPSSEAREESDVMQTPPNLLPPSPCTTLISSRPVIDCTGSGGYLLSQASLWPHGGAPPVCPERLSTTSEEDTSSQEECFPSSEYSSTAGSPELCAVSPGICELSPVELGMPVSILTMDVLRQKKMGLSRAKGQRKSPVSSQSGPSRTASTASLSTAESGGSNGSSDQLAARAQALARGSGGWAKAYQSSSGNRRESLRFLCMTGIVSTHELSDDSMSISDEHIEECISIAVDMLGSLPYEVWIRKPKEACKVFEDHYTTIYSPKYTYGAVIFSPTPSTWLEQGCA